MSEESGQKYVLNCKLISIIQQILTRFEDTLIKVPIFYTLCQVHGILVKSKKLKDFHAAVMNTLLLEAELREE